MKVSNLNLFQKNSKIIVQICFKLVKVLLPKLKKLVVAITMIMPMSHLFSLFVLIHFPSNHQT